MGLSLTKDISSYLASQGLDLAPGPSPDVYHVLGTQFSNWATVLYIKDESVSYNIISKSILTYVDIAGKQMQDQNPRGSIR